MGGTIMGEVRGNIVAALLLFSVIVVVIKLVCREIVCWYFKFNQSIAILTEIRDLLAAKENSQNTTSPSGEGTPVPANETPPPCSACGSTTYYRVSTGGARCSQCGAQLYKL